MQEGTTAGEKKSDDYNDNLRAHLGGPHHAQQPPPHAKTRTETRNRPFQLHA